MRFKPKKKDLKRSLKEFGFLFSFIFIGLGLWQAYATKPSNVLGCFALALALTLVTFIFPMSLKYPYLLWMKLGHLLGRINSHLIFGIIYVLLFIPIGLILRLKGNDPLKLKTKDTPTYWESTRETFSDRFTQQF